MSDMVERVARAIAASYGGGRDAVTPDHLWVRIAASAAIEAYEEAMAEAGFVIVPRDARRDWIR